MGKTIGYNTRMTEELTAEKLANCQKLFGDLPYTPQDADNALEIAKEIEEKSKLGFGEVNLDYITPMMQETLKNKGFKVIEIFYCEYSIDMDWLGIFNTVYYGKYYPKTRFVLQWKKDLAMPILRSEEFLSLQECAEYCSEKSQKAYDKAVEERRKQKEEQEEDNRKFKEAYTLAMSAPQVKEHNGGCMGLFILGGALGVLGYYLF
jgi:hypothetical protein